MTFVRLFSISIHAPCVKWVDGLCKVLVFKLCTKIFGENTSNCRQHIISNVWLGNTRWYQKFPFCWWKALLPEERDFLTKDQGLQGSLPNNSHWPHLGGPQDSQSTTIWKLCAWSRSGVFWKYWAIEGILLLQERNVGFNPFLHALFVKFTAHISQ